MPGPGYANITKGLRGDPNHQEDVRHYETLRKLVGEGRVICYFSHIHVVEAIRSSGDDWLQAYSRVVDSLTHGHCMVFTSELHRRELQHFVGEVFGLPVRLSTPELAFGRGFEAFLDPEPELARWLDESTTMNQAMSETLQERAVNRKQRRQFAAMGERLFSKFVVPTDIDMSNMPPPVADLFRQPDSRLERLRGRESIERNAFVSCWTAPRRSAAYCRTTDRCALISPRSGSCSTMVRDASWTPLSGTARHVGRYQSVNTK